MLYLMHLFFLVAFLFNLSSADEICYDKYGCFNDERPFDNPFVPLPQSPKAMGTRYLLFTRDNPTNFKIMDDNNVTKLQSSGYDGTKKTTMIIHGWRENVIKSTWILSLKSTLLARAEHNVIVVEWKEGAQQSYEIAAANTRMTGAMVAEMIKFLNKQTGNTPSSFHVIGYSLGAQVSGYAGRRLNHAVKIGRITGLDPAGPFFADTDTDVRLDTTDADFVDVIHTSMGILGTSTQSGHIDFYPNSGQNQRGCEISEVGLESLGCGHGRAHEFFIESITSKCPFRAYPCNGGWDNFTQGYCLICPNGGCPQMGYNAIYSKGKAFGKYYLFTNDKSSFSCGIRRIAKVKMYTGNGGWLWNGGGRNPGTRVYGNNGDNTGVIRLGNRNMKRGSTETFIAPFKELGTLKSIDVWQYQLSPNGWDLKKVLIEFSSKEKYSACFNDAPIFRIAVTRSLMKGDQSCKDDKEASLTE